MGEIKIHQRAIPEPVRGRKGKWAAALQSIKPKSKDSFDVPWTSLPNVYSAARRLGMKITVRRQGEAVAIWRLK